jgi:hypothetical protein
MIPFACLLAVEWGRHGGIQELERKKSPGTDPLATATLRLRTAPGGYRQSCRALPATVLSALHTNGATALPCQ